MEYISNVNMEPVRASGERNLNASLRKTYYILYEGRNTERFYFNALRDNKDDLGINAMVDIKPCDNGGNSNSYPRHLFEFSKKTKIDVAFDEEKDTMILVFDADMYEMKPGYDELIEDIEKENEVAAVSNPNFELFLLLHLPDAYKQYIEGHEEEFFLDKNGGKTGSLNYAKTKVSAATHKNPKKNKKIGELSLDVQNAIEQESHINEEIHDVKGVVSCNVAKIIEGIINDKPPYERL